MTTYPFRIQFFDGDSGLIVETIGETTPNDLEVNIGAALVAATRPVHYAVIHLDMRPGLTMFIND